MNIITCDTSKRSMHLSHVLSRFITIYAVFTRKSNLRILSISEARNCTNKKSCPKWAAFFIFCSFNVTKIEEEHMESVVMLFHNNTEYEKIFREDSRKFPLYDAPPCPLMDKERFKDEQLRKCDCPRLHEIILTHIQECNIEGQCLVRTNLFVE